MKLIFGSVYVLIAIVFALHFYLNFFSLVFSVLLALYLIGKGILFALMKTSPLSALDSVAGFYFLLLALSIFPNSFVTIIFLLYLAQKGIFQGLRDLY